jgi:hypothetical protein
MQGPEWFLLVAAPSALGRAPARSQPSPPAGPDPPRSRSGVRRKCGLTVHSRTLAHQECYSPTLRLDLEAVEELVRQLAGEAVSRDPKAGTSHRHYWRSAAVRAWTRPWAKERPWRNLSAN